MLTFWILTLALLAIVGIHFLYSDWWNEGPGGGGSYRMDPNYKMDPVLREAVHERPQIVARAMRRGSNDSAM